MRRGQPKNHVLKNVTTILPAYGFVATFKCGYSIRIDVDTGSCDRKGRGLCKQCEKIAKAKL